MMIICAFLLFDYEEIKSKFKDVNNRILVIAVIFLLVFSAVIFKIFYLQVVKHEYFMRRMSLDTELVSRETYERSTIYDRDGRILAASVKKPSLFINPKEIRSTMDSRMILWLVSELAEKTGKPVDHIMNAVNRDSHFSYIARLVSSDDFEDICRINDLAKERYPDNVKGEILKHKIEYDRVYPSGESLSYVIGRTDPYGVGKEGIELVFDKYLRHSKKDNDKNTIDGRGNILRISSAYKRERSRVYDLYLTISLPVQQKVNEINKEIWKKYDPAYSIILVQQVGTGEILAFSVYPPLSAADETSRKIFANPAVAYSYEPGSTFKAVSFSYLIENGIIDINDEEKVFCENGYYSCGKYKFHDVHPYGDLRVSEIFSKSSNIGTIKLSMGIPKNLWVSYLEKCGFGEKTGIPLNAESSGSLTNLSVLNDEHSRYLSFIGQGISVTPLQLLSFYQAIANDGFLVKPRIVRYLSNTLYSRIDIDQDRSDERRIFSENTAAILRCLLHDTVLSGTGKRAQVAGLDVGGKTGTAQIFNSETKSYYDEKYISSFIGIAPAYNPEVVILVLVNSPKGEYYGGVVAAPYFSKIAEFAINYQKLSRQRYIKRM